MIVLEPELFLDEGLIKLFKPRAFNRVLKEGFHIAMEKWHSEILPQHFRRRAYDKYRSSYIRKKKKGRPMVLTGQLEKSVKKRINISGTSKRVRGTVFYGRPSTLSKHQVINRTFAKMEKNKIKWKQANRQVYSEMGSYAKNALQFEMQISAFTNADIVKIQEWVVEHIVKSMENKNNLKKVRGV